MKKEMTKKTANHFNRCAFCGKELKVNDRIIVARSGNGMKSYCRICGSRLDETKE